MGYEVVHSKENTIITIDGLKVKVTTDHPVPGTAFALGTLYKVKGSFRPFRYTSSGQLMRR